MTEVNKFKNAKDFRKTLEARLQREASETGVDLQRVRRQVAFDRLLARFFIHPESSFFLKGGYAMELRLSSARATRDIDLTYLQRVQKQEDSFAEHILNDLQKLAAADLGDFFSYELGSSQFDLDNALYGGARYPVSSFIDQKLFVRFHLDVGGDVLVSATETLMTPDWLKYCGISAPAVRMISIEQQFAEKIHAYTLPREGGRNSRVKDLVDVLLLMQMCMLDLDKSVFILRQVFKIRNTHSLPLQLPSPPIEWVTPYSVLAVECGIEKNMTLAFQEVASTYENIINTHKTSSVFATMPLL